MILATKKFSPHVFRACEAAEHRDLAYMRERIGDRSLEERFGGGMHGLVGREVVVEGLERGEEAGLLLRARGEASNCAIVRFPAPN